MGCGAGEESGPTSVITRAEDHGFVPVLSKILVFLPSRSLWYFRKKLDSHVRHPVS